MFYMLGRGDYAAVHPDANVAVATLESGVETTTTRAERRFLEAARLGEISLLHPNDVGERSLIVEAYSPEGYDRAFENIQIALDGLYTATCLGGYVLQPANV
jgi:hypothetical protein